MPMEGVEAVRKFIRQTATAISRRRLIVLRSFHFAFVSFRKCNFIFKRTLAKRAYGGILGV